MRDFAGKVAVVTGAASGIGRGLAERFAREGMQVVLADVQADALDATVGELQAQDLDVIGVQVDVSRLEQVEALRDRALERYGKVHVLCNNAGVAGALRYGRPPPTTGNGRSASTCTASFGKVHVLCLRPAGVAADWGAAICRQTTANEWEWTLAPACPPYVNLYGVIHGVTGVTAPSTSRS